MPHTIEQQLILHEGLRLTAYQDTLGFWTIGVGRLIDARRGGGISEDEAMMLLNHDIFLVENWLRIELPWFNALDPVRRRILVDMGFNLGREGLLKFRKMLTACEAKHYIEAAKEMLDSGWAGQVGVRAVRLAAMMRTGEDYR